MLAERAHSQCAALRRSALPESQSTCFEGLHSVPLVVRSLVPPTVAEPSAMHVRNLKQKCFPNGGLPGGQLVIANQGSTSSGLEVPIESRQPMEARPAAKE